MQRRTVLTSLLALTASGRTSAEGGITRAFPQNSLRGRIAFGEPPEVILNDRPARLSPGARIRTENNMLALSGSLTGRRVDVNYTLDNAGQLRDIWVLRDEERSRRWPSSPEQASRWGFDPGSQTWALP
jgi:hypothetical protein